MEMSNEIGSRVRYDEAFWRAHHEAWQKSELNQREYCEAQGIPLKAFGNWRARFKAEPQPPSPKLLYRRRGLSHTLSHRLSHMTNGSPMSGPIVPPAREGRRAQFRPAWPRGREQFTGSLIWTRMRLAVPGARSTRLEHAPLHREF